MFIHTSFSIAFWVIVVCLLFENWYSPYVLSKIVVIKRNTFLIYFV